MQISFKPAVHADIPVIRSLAEAIWYRHYPGIITHEQIAYMLDMMYAEESISRQIEQKQNYTIIYSGDQPVGYYAVSEKSPGYFFLNKFYVDTERHRVGIGSSAFDHLIRNDCKGYKEITLQVNRRNIKAINFYFKKGFVIDHAFDFDIGGGYSMDDFLMVLRAAD